MFHDVCKNFRNTTTGIFEYILAMSSDVKEKWGRIGDSFMLRISSLVFFMLKEYGSGVN